MFDNLNTLLLDIFKESRLSGEPYISKMQEIEAVSVPTKLKYYKVCLSYKVKPIILFLTNSTSLKAVTRTKSTNMVGIYYKF